MIRCLNTFLVNALSMFFTMCDVIRNRKSAGAIGIIGAADGPTSIFLTSNISSKQKGRFIAAIGAFALTLSAIAFLIVSCKCKKGSCPFSR